MEYSVEITKNGPPEVMSIIKSPIQSPSEGEVLVRHKAIGVNFIDIYYRNGIYPLASLPGKIGHEASGVVEAVGQGAKGFKEGDRVAYVSPTPGSYCTSRNVPAEILIKIPKEINFETAASMLLKGMTVHYLFKRTSNLQKFHSVLFHAAAGGTGLIAMQWAKLLGAKIIGTVSSEEKVKLAKKYGADFVINYAREDFVERTLEISSGKGVDIVFDSIGQKTFYQSLRCLKKYGLMVSFGNASGKLPSFDLGLLNGHLFITRPTLWQYTADADELTVTAQELISLVKDKKIQIPVFQKYPLNEVVRVHQLLESRKTVGSTILIP
ncbi:MAG: quinone oxidoreductase [Betaproteobacteria bacterium TMED100]|nr:MAG: quinone oxidoreductase [Betaproteobacteria bacterium TMED100]